MEITYSDVQILNMSEDMIAKLELLHPKKVYFQMETSGSPSAWTNHGEYLVGTKGSDILDCAYKIQQKNTECEAHRDWNFDAHIRVIF